MPVTLKKLDGLTYEGKYEPIKEGRHVVMITYGGQEVNNSPFQVYAFIILYTYLKNHSFNFIMNRYKRASFTFE